MDEIDRKQELVWQQLNNKLSIDEFDQNAMTFGDLTLQNQLCRQIKHW